MNITVFTSNQPRHVALVERLAGLADTVFACMEVNTLFPGQIEGFYRTSEVMQRYFGRVVEAERAEFGVPRFLPANVRSLPMKSGDLNSLPTSWLAQALDSDVYVVFGASYIRKPLVDELIERRALNIHMGTSPYYRGSSCNFWAMYDGRPEYVGATVHLLGSGLDSGAILSHALPTIRGEELADGFFLGMRAVSEAFDVLVSLVDGGRWQRIEPVPQDLSLQLRYSRISDFTDEVAAEYLRREPTSESIRESLQARDTTRFILLPGEFRRGERV